MDLKKINISDYDYALPEERIAQYPVQERDSSRMLIYKNGRINDDVFRNAADHIPEGSLLVFNNTRVIRARLLFKKDSGANIEILCLEPLNPSDFAISFGSTKPVEWKCMVGNLKKWKNGDIRMAFTHQGKEYILKALRNGGSGEAQNIIFSWNPGDLCFSQIITAAGHLPLPPYINRLDTDEDSIRYQTIYSKNEGSVAAPTAGLHFSDQVFKSLRARGIRTTEITLHVGAGTFKPVKYNDISKHEMHSEHFHVPVETLELLLKYQGKVIAVGTTSVRTIESLYWIGAKIAAGSGQRPDEFMVDQWEPYENDPTFSFGDSIKAIISFLKKEKKGAISASTSIIIVPGYKFRAVDAMFTNFHQPRSTLLLLVSAWVGENWKNIYNYALSKNFRFLSYGDSSVIFRNT